jgi:hypothetical protein
MHEYVFLFLLISLGLSVGQCKCAIFSNVLLVDGIQKPDLQVTHAVS